MSRQKRQLAIKIYGESIGKGRIPVDLLNKILKGIQTVIYQLGDYHFATEYADHPSFHHKGRFSKKVVEACSLELVSIKDGSFSVCLELSDNVQLDLYGDLGEKSIQSFQQILQQLVDKKQISSIVKDHSVKHKILRTLKEFLPRDHRYSLTFQWDSRPVYIDSKAVKALSKQLHTPTRDERELFGKMVALKIIEDRYFTMLANDKQVKCYYDEEDEQEIIRALGKDVWIHGLVVLNEEGDIQSFRRVRDITVIEPGIFSIDKVHWENRLFLFKEPIDVAVTQTDQLWILEYEPLDILCYDDTFQKTIEQFYEEIAVLWDEFVENEEQNLAPNGLRLRNELIRRVEKVVGDE
ncbi:hypothetical protein [Parageobacillus thermoglucosidasius]|uniref:hypothetical protein n=1 Tax=Parageobacillus thermoglucosidasius TaxID=1426 RepID=UPI000B55F588|nr:hypothetical protein [Parageobacillus thermoglucosidasius]OUM85010.1 MAG: hypothetical protein BAA00_21765 [Parageobacillus thermoglucosidasius]